MCDSASLKGPGEISDASTGTLAAGAAGAERSVLRTVSVARMRRCYVHLRQVLPYRRT